MPRTRHISPLNRYDYLLQRGYSYRDGAACLSFGTLVSGAWIHVMTCKHRGRATRHPHDRSDNSDTQINSITLPHFHCSDIEDRIKFTSIITKITFKDATSLRSTSYVARGSLESLPAPVEACPRRAARLSHGPALARGLADCSASMYIVNSYFWVSTCLTAPRASHSMSDGTHIDS